MGIPIEELKHEVYCAGFSVTEEALENLPQIFQDQIRKEWQKDRGVYFMYTEEYMKELGEENE